MDQHHDSMLVLAHSLLAQGVLPEMVKSAQILDRETELPQLPATCFADPSQRLFPIYNPEQTLLSAGYFFKQGCHETAPPQVMENLTKAAFAHGVQDEFKDIVQAIIAPMQKAAAEQDPTNYALLVQNPNGEVRGRYFIPSPPMVKQADEHFVANHEKYPMGWRVTIGQALVKKAQQFGIPVQNLHPVTRAYGGDNACHSTRAATEIAKRAYACTDYESRKAYTLLAQIVPGQMSDVDSLEKVAYTLDLLDRHTGLDRHYGQMFLDPYKTVFNMTKEAAEEVISIIDLLGNQFTRDDLMSVGPGAYEKVLGPEFVKAASDDDGNLSFEKLSTILTTLPRDEKALLGQYLQSVLDTREHDSELLQAVPAA